MATRKTPEPWHTSWKNDISVTCTEGKIVKFLPKNKLFKKYLV